MLIIPHPQLQPDAHLIASFIQAAVDIRHHGVGGGQDIGNVLDQVTTIEGPQRDLYRVGGLWLVAPAHLQQAGTVLPPPAQDLAAVLTMDGDAAAAGDISRHRVTRNRLTAFCNGGQQVAHALDGNVIRPGRRPAALPHGHPGQQVFSLRYCLVGAQARQRTHHLADGQVATADSHVQVIGVTQAEAFHHRRELRHEIFREQSHAPDLAFDGLLAGPQVVVMALFFEPLAHFAARPAAMNVALARVQPVAAGTGLFRRQNFHAIAGFHLMRQRHDTTVDFRPAATVTHFGVYLVSKIQHRCPGRQIDHLAFGCQHIHPLLAGDGTKAVQQALVVELFLAGFQQCPHDRDFFLECGVTRTAFLVTPVGGHAQLGVFMHLPRADLHFQNSAFGVGDRRMQ